MTQIEKAGPRGADTGKVRAVMDDTRVGAEIQAPCSGRATAFQPPKDPVLRAMWQVCQFGSLNSPNDHLSPFERIALFALWRYLGDDRKKIGPSLLAYLIGTTRNQAKRLLHNLQQKRYVGSTGRRGRGPQPKATRWITKKTKLGKRIPSDSRSEESGYPAVSGQSGHRGVTARVPGSTPNRVPWSTPDQGVDNRPRGRSAPTAMTSGQEANVEERPPDDGITDDSGEQFDIAAIMSGGVARG